MTIRSLFLRALLAFLALPGMVAFVIPALLAWPVSVVRPTGLVLVGVGTLLLLWSVREFYTAGKATLAPWDAPRHLVTSGPYRWSRNPMYVGVILILSGWAWTTALGRLWLYAGVVAAAFHLRVAFFEERQFHEVRRKTWDPYRATVPRWIFRSRRAVVITAVAFLIALPLAGLVFEAYMDGRTRREFQAPGTFVDVDGRQLHLLCIGEGSPIVMFEASGFGQPAISAQTVRDRVASRTRVCSYDRIGMGWSDPAPSVLTAGELARELAVLQDRASLPAPFIIVASSVGGLTAEMFARQYPERTAGLIFLDAGTSQLARSFQPHLWWAPASAAVVNVAAQLGAVRLLDPFNLEGDSDDMRRSRGFTYGARAVGTLLAIVRGGEETIRQFEAAPPLRSDVPMTVLSASSPEMIEIPGLRRWSVTRSELRLTAHRNLAAQSTRGSWKVVPDSQHLIATDKPDIVIDEILAMLEEIK